MRALIDADVVLYSSGFAAQKKFYIVNGNIHNSKADAKAECDDSGQPYSVIAEGYEVEELSHALHNAKSLIERCFKETGATDYTLYLTGDTNFRDDLVTYYKENRADSPKPYHYDAIKDYLINKWGAVVVEGQEADDKMAQEQWKDFIASPKDMDCETVICTIDKDLDMVPGWHYNWRKDVLYWQDMAPALLFFYTQLLTGDRVDNIQGVPGIGPKKAEAILEGCETEIALYMRVLNEYHLAIKKYKIEVPKLFSGTDFDYAVEILQENADLLWMRRVEGVSWQPPTQLEGDDA